MKTHPVSNGMTCIFCKLSKVAYHWFLAFGSALYYRFPSRELIVIGVTGTNGKSSVVEMVHAILEEAGYKVASFSSVRAKIGNEEHVNALKMTMPGKGALQKFLREAADARCKFAVLEVTSEGIRQFRHAFIDFGTAVLTNVTPEHIESHGSFEKYRAEKMKLFRRIKTSIVNIDDENAKYFLPLGSQKIYGYTLGNKLLNSAQRGNLTILEAKDVQTSAEGSEFQADGISFHLPILGEFNVYNALAAVCVGLAYKVPFEIAVRALKRFHGVPGRMEVVIDRPFRVIVDYAHTPDALEKVYKTLRDKGQGTRDKLHNGTPHDTRGKTQINKLNNGTPHDARGKTQINKLICVLGAAGGGRDKWKRPEMGKIAAHYCDEIILTDEDPYEENPSQILAQISGGFLQTPHSKFQDPHSYSIILDRRQAVRTALKMAKQNDIVMITGKGCEPWMMTKHGKIPWDDRRIVREEFGTHPL
jgi:UDP-N-acetylmuramoyl-L-alanyl-D-glutamate--2,6-diaminopimelate ligase